MFYMKKAAERSDSPDFEIVLYVDITASLNATSTIS